MESIVVDGPPLVLDLTAGHLPAADADRPCATGQPATAVLTQVTDVAVPEVALPGPTASLCDLTLQVSRRDGQVYTARTRLGFRDAHRRALIAVPERSCPYGSAPRTPPASPSTSPPSIEAAVDRWMPPAATTTATGSSRAGDRWIDRALHSMAAVQLRHAGTDGRRCYDRRVATRLPTSSSSDSSR